jgi:hypothetical protein
MDCWSGGNKCLLSDPACPMTPDIAPIRLYDCINGAQPMVTTDPTIWDRLDVSREEHTMEHAIIWPLPGDGEETEVRLFPTDEAAVMWAGDNLPSGGWQYARVIDVPDGNKFSTFQPIVTVEGTHIDIDWSDSHVATTIGHVEQPVLDDEASKILDAALGFPEELSSADRLRKLADYLDAHPGDSDE